MKIEPKEVTLKDGRKVIIRSPEEKDAQTIIDLVTLTAGETYFMANYPEEYAARMTLEKEIARLLVQVICTGIVFKNLQLHLFKAQLPGIFQCHFNKNCSETAVAVFPRNADSKGCPMLHLDFICNFNNSCTSNTAFTIKGTERCIPFRLVSHVYPGFRVTGVIPHAFKLKDGTYRDAINMVCML